MAQVLIVESDVSIRDALHDILADAGHTIFEAESLPTGPRSTLAFLRAAAEPMVVLFDVGPLDANPASFLEQIVAAPDAPLLLRHAFICLTTVPAQLPEALQVLFARLGVAVVAKPFDMDALVAVVAEDARRLAAGS